MEDPHYGKRLIKVYEYLSDKNKAETGKKLLKKEFMAMLGLEFDNWIHYRRAERFDGARLNRLEKLKGYGINIKFLSEKDAPMLLDEDGERYLTLKRSELKELLEAASGSKETVKAIQLLTESNDLMRQKIELLERMVVAIEKDKKSK